MTTMILVPGMWLGAWAWDDVARDLAAAGHDPRPITLTGVAERAAEATAKTDLDTHVADVIDMIRANDLTDVVLVGHSYGGMVVSVAAGQIADRVKRVVYVDSGALPEGMSQFDSTPPEQQEQTRAQVGDGFLVPPPPFQPAEGDPMIAGLDDATLTRIRELVTPHPFGSVIQPVHYAEAFHTVPSALISCTFPAGQVREMIASGHPFFALMQDTEIFELPTGHWPMFSRPADLAKILAEAAA